MNEPTEQERKRHRNLIEWEGIVQQWGLDMADPGSPFGQIAEKVSRAQFREQLRVERAARGDKKIMQWWENLKNEHNQQTILRDKRTTSNGIDVQRDREAPGSQTA